MASQTDDIILENFRAGEKGFGDLNSIVQRRCDTVKYFIHRGSALGGYDTGNVDDLLSERNGSETRIRSVTVHASGPEALKLSIEFDDEVVISGECEDRTRLVLLTTEVRAVIKDEMKGRVPTKTTILQALGVLFLIVGYVVFQQIQSSYVNRIDTSQLVRVNQLEAPYKEELNKGIPSNQKLLSQATGALAANNLNAEVRVLLQQQIGELRQSIIDNEEERVTNPIYSAPPWWSTSGWSLIAAGAVAAAVAVGVAYLVVPSNKSVFLIGDEITRQERVDKRRERMVWGVGITFLLGLVSGFISSFR